MLKKAQVFALPTNKKPYSLEKWGVHWFYTGDEKYSNREPKPIGHYLYFTTDGEIGNNWYVDTMQNTIRKDCNNCVAGGYKKKIVATTNPDLWYGDRYVGGVSVSQYLAVPKIGLDFVEAFAREQGIKEVMLDFIDHYTCKACNELGVWHCAHPEECQNMVYKTEPKLRSNGSVIVHPVKEKVYTREEIKNKLKEGCITCPTCFPTLFDKWFDARFPN